MKYIKLFEAFDRLSRDQKTELQDYCETNLAYLMDEGFKIRIGQNIDKTLFSTCSRATKLASQKIGLASRLCFVQGIDNLFLKQIYIYIYW